MALAPFRRERAVKKILLVKALPLRVVLLYRTAGWNARLFRKSLCKRLCKSLKTLSSAGGRPFRRSSGAPLEASQALPGPGIFAMTWRGSAAVWRRRQEGTGHRWFPFPSCSRRRAAAMPGLPIGSQSRLRRQAAGTAEPLPVADGKERGRACRYSKNLKVSPSALGFSAENPSFFSQDCSGFSPPEALE